MSNTNKILLRLIFTVISAIAITTNVQAEEFFTKLLGGSKGADFNTLLSHVPADTAYLLANKKAIPKEVMKFHLNRSKDIMEMFSKAKKEDSSDGAGQFFIALMEDYNDLLAKDKFEESGLSLKANSLVYGYKMLPVMRLSFADKEKLMAMIKRAEEKSGYQVALKKCGDSDCFTSTDDKGDFSVALVFLENHLAASVYSPDKKEQIINHLIGKSDPKEAFSTDKWDTFLKENDYAGFGDGFINLKKIFNNTKPFIAVGILDKIDEKEVEGCLAVAEAHIDNMPEILFGTKNLKAKAMDYELLLKTSSEVSEILQGLANKTNISKRSENAIFDFGININFIKLRDALTQYANFLVKAGETYKCSAIKTPAIRKGMGGLAMVMNMGLTQFKSIYGSVSDVDFDDKMQPKNIDAMLSLGTDDPGGLIAMVGMVSPALKGFQVPDDGTSVKLPSSAIPSKGKPIPPIYLSRSNKSLSIMLGNDKPALTDYKTETPQLSFSSMNGKRYMDKFTSILKSMPKLSNDKDQLKILETAGGLSGKVMQETSADERGLVLNYHVEYE